MKIVSDKAARERLRKFLRDLPEDTVAFSGWTRVVVKSRGSTGDTPLHIAIIRGDFTAASDLLNVGADPNVAGEDGFTPLHWAAQRSAQFVRLLLAHGASPAAVNDFGDTPIDIARRQSDTATLAQFHD